MLKLSPDLCHNCSDAVSEALEVFTESKNAEVQKIIVLIDKGLIHGGLTDGGLVGRGFIDEGFVDES
jgi:hypothetical protein